MSKPNSDELEKLMPRCETSDREDFPNEHIDDSERCFNCQVWEAIDKRVREAISDELEKLNDIQIHQPMQLGTTIISRLAHLNQLKEEQSDE